MKPFIGLMTLLALVSGCNKLGLKAAPEGEGEREALRGLHAGGSQSTTIDVTKGPYNICADCDADQTDKIVQAIADGVAQGKTVYFPKGTYQVSRTIATVGPRQLLVLKGESRSLTTIKLIAPLGNRGLVEAVGAAVPGQADKRHHAQVEVSDITFDARSGEFSAPGHSADCFRLSDVVLAKFESVIIAHFDGAAIHGYGWWDSVLTDVHFIRSGSEVNRTPAVILSSRDNDQKDGSTNNIQFTNCRWEANRYVDLRMTEGTRKVHVLASKFHGILPQSAPYDHVQVVDSNSNTFAENNFTNGGSTSLRIVRSYGNTVTGNTIGGQPGFAIYLQKSPRNVIMGNSLNVEASSPGNGDIFWDTNPGSSFIGNVGRRHCVLTGDIMNCGALQPSSSALLESILR